MSYPGGRIRINPVIVDLRGYEAVRAPLGTLTCIEKFQSEAIVGFLTAALVEAAALFGGHYRERPVALTGGLYRGRGGEGN